jgi:hypothetical protein
MHFFGGTLNSIQNSGGNIFPDSGFLVGAQCTQAERFSPK